MPSQPDTLAAKALLIDLDDTLYDEGDYVRSGFRVVAAEIATLSPDRSEAAIHAAMLTELKAHGRGKVFDRALEVSGLRPDPALVASLVALYRNHAPTISLWPGVREVLLSLRQDFRLAIVTDGTELMQRRKVEALGVASLVDQVAYCWEIGAPKPSPLAYLEALNRLAVSADAAVVIGDNPDHDMAAAQALPCPSIRVRTGKYAQIENPRHSASFDVASFLNVADHLTPMPIGARQ